MNLENEINSFHRRINYKLVQQPIMSLENHLIKVSRNFANRRTMLKVRAFHYTILSAKRSDFNSPLLTKSKPIWEETDQKSFYYEQELKDFALHCLYLTNTPLGECIVQRCSKKGVQVVQLQSLTVEQLTYSEQEYLAAYIRNSHKDDQVTFGADLELMLRNNKTFKFMNGHLLKNMQFGYDDAIAIHKNRVAHPIFEIRPKPASKIEDLHNHLMILFQKFKRQTQIFDLQIITDPNPFGRFFLGGHIHFGNTPFTFQHVRLLDQYVAIPYALADKNPSFERRTSYGMLGAVRKNQYNGFEYRVLPTWFHIIPSCLPLLLWIEYLITNAHHIETLELNRASVTSYYNKDHQNYQLDQWEKDNKKKFAEKKGERLFEPFVSYLKKL
ncbi:MAG: putative amidoligase domain-containing protein [Anaerobacillus sp.]|uniref:putative amidoligase domain-containing protein n=1 Tax=Anaerobacillus sp. TaxID=1872506 RepID=UPI00391CC9A6